MYFPTTARTSSRTFEAAGSSLEQVVKAQVFLTDLRNFNGFDEVWKEYFKVPPPRTTIGTTGLLVENALVEIDLIGIREGVAGSLKKEFTASTQNHRAAAPRW